MAPVWAKRMPFLNWLDRPLDANKKLFGKPILGRNKTYRGFVAGAIFATVIGAAQWALSEAVPALNRLEFFDLDFAGYLELSLLLGFGALVGDAVESFLKRQLEIPAGESWVPLDQIDYVIGALLFSIPLGALTIGEYAAVAFVGVLFHPVGTVVGWKLGLKDKPI